MEDLSLESVGDYISSRSESVDLFDSSIETSADSAILECCDCTKKSLEIAALERDLHTAATVGQVILREYEASEREKRAMQSDIEQLALQLQALSEENTALLQTNSDLLQESFEIQQALDFSDCLVESLTRNLEKVRVQLRELTRASYKTRRMEDQIAMLEEAQEVLQSELDGSIKDKSFLETKLRKSQRLIEQLTLQMDALETQLSPDPISSPIATSSAKRVSVPSKMDTISSPIAMSSAKQSAASSAKEIAASSSNESEESSKTASTKWDETPGSWETRRYNLPGTPTPVSYSDIAMLDEYSLQGTPIPQRTVPIPPLPTPPRESLAPTMVFNTSAQAKTTTAAVHVPTIKNKSSSRDLLLKASQTMASAKAEVETEPYMHSAIDDLREALDTAI